MKFRCPDSVSGVCSETRCGGYLVNPRQDGFDDNMNPLYTAACVFDGALEYFYGLRPEPAGNSDDSDRIPSQSKTIPILERLVGIVETHCAKSKESDFLFANAEYVAALEELWANQTTREFSVSCQESIVVTDLWRRIRLGVVAYAKCLIEPVKWVVKELGSESHFMLVPKFMTPDDPPHILDGMVMKTFYATLQIAESPRRTIRKSPAYKSPTVVHASAHPDVDIAALPCRTGRFAHSRDYTTIVDVEHGAPDYEVYPYLDLKDSAAQAIKLLLSQLGKKKNGGMVRATEIKRGVFQGKPYTTFKSDQIQVLRHEGLSYWRIIPDEMFHAFYCKRHPKNKSF